MVIDVLRWSTTVLTALENGAEAVEAFDTPQAAMARADTLRPRPLLGGERDARIIPGFDLGNSPAEYTRDRVAGRVVLTTTTNGTQALLAARKAHAVLIGAFVNLDAIATACAVELRAGRDVVLLCAGQAGNATAEDTCCAGAIAERLTERSALDEAECDPNTLTARNNWRASDQSANEVLRGSAHAAELTRQGFAADVSFCGRESASSAVAERRGEGLEMRPINP